MREQAIQRAGNKYLEKLGAWVVKVITCTKNGCPDTLVAVPTVITEEMVGQTVGLFYAVEYKTPKGVLRPIQEYQIKKIREAGGTAVVARSPDDVKALFKD